MSGPQQTPYAPLIPASVNFASNTSVSLKSQNIYMNALNIPYNVSGSSGLVTFSGGSLTGLITSSNLNDVATKEYTDSIPFPEPGGPIDNSIQVNAGSGLFNGYDTLKWSTTTPYTLNLVGSLNLGGSGLDLGIVIVNNRIENLSEPVFEQSASNKEYVVSSENIQVINLMTTNSINAVTTYLEPSQVINVILQRSFNTNGPLNQDILPNASDIISALNSQVSAVQVGLAFTFIYKYINKAQDSSYQVLVLYGNTDGNSMVNIIPKGDYFYINTEDNNINIYPETIVEFTGTVINITSGLEVVNFYINNYQQLYTNNTQQQTPYGLLTDNFYINKNAIFNNAFVIRPVNPDLIRTDTSYTYTFQDLKDILIIRSGSNTMIGLPNDVIDDLDSTANMLSNDAFAMGSGLLRFTVQNIDSTYSVTIGSTNDVGWSFTGSTTIKAGYNGLFGASFNVEQTSATLFTIGLVPRNGL